jgi:hypothetical protein
MARAFPPALMQGNAGREAGRERGMPSISHQPNAFPWRVWHGMNGEGDYVTFHRVPNYQTDGSVGWDYIAECNGIGELVIYGDQISEYESLGHALMAHVMRAATAAKRRKSLTADIARAVPGDPALVPVVDPGTGAATFM